MKRKWPIRFQKTTNVAAGVYLCNNRILCNSYHIPSDLLMISRRKNKFDLVLYPGFSILEFGAPLWRNLEGKARSSQGIPRHYDVTSTDTMACPSWWCNCQCVSREMNKYDARLRQLITCRRTHKVMKASSDDMVAPSLRCEILSGFPLQSHETNTGMAGKSRYEASSDLHEWYHW